MITKKEVRERMRAYIGERTQAQAAKEFGVTRSYVNQVLRGKANAGPTILRKLGLRKPKITQYEESK